MSARIALAAAAVLAVLGTARDGAAAEGGNPHGTKPCELCHAATPRFGVDTRETVTFRTSWDDPGLCTSCHRAEENIHPLLVVPGPDALGTRAPEGLPLGETGELAGKVVCTTCHFIHAAETRHALLRGFPGSQDPDRFAAWQDLCRQCHGTTLEKRSPHEGDERACVFCHAAKPAPGQQAQLTQRAGSLCSFCHGGDRDRHYARANPYGREVACYICHDPHADASSAARLRSSYLQITRDRVRLDPHYRKALCFACHLDEAGSPLRSADPVALCNRCHGTGEITGEIHPIRKVPPAIATPAGWPLDEGRLSCLTCHTAGHPEDRGRRKFLRGGPYADRNDFCENCHFPDALQGRNPHLDINAGEGCEFCHAVRPVPGKDTIETVRFIAEPNILCLRCHAQGPHPAGFEHTMTIEEARARSIPPVLPVHQGRMIVCATCHNPHVAQSEDHKLRGEGGIFQICGLCHKGY